MNEGKRILGLRVSVTGRQLEQKERDDREALEKFYALTGQKPQPPGD